ncbi:hypothetical protein BC829DRAFT_396475 [Chytridium lagenaria]|nr:hypothetical protein BC829DRAFT_396475 [Chytridium lagenaria]
MRLVIILLLSTLHLISAQPCRRICPTNYDPVCGSDRRTYSNSCALSLASCRDIRITLASKGACPRPPPPPPPPSCDRLCTAIVDPVCGSDGVTYSNPCRLSIAVCKNPKISISAKGACKPSTPPPPPPLTCDKMCPSIYDPVCGTDGKTYPSVCALSVATCRDPLIAVAAKGECALPPTGPGCAVRCNTQLVQQVCGTDGKTYQNDCFLLAATCTNAALTKAKDGAC